VAVCSTAGAAAVAFTLHARAAGCRSVLSGLSSQDPLRLGSPTGGIPPGLHLPKQSCIRDSVRRSHGAHKYTLWGVPSVCSKHWALRSAISRTRTLPTERAVAACLRVSHDEKDGRCQPVLFETLAWGVLGPRRVKDPSREGVPSRKKCPKRYQFAYESCRLFSLSEDVRAMGC
jgi:hypothetical protein